MQRTYKLYLPHVHVTIQNIYNVDIKDLTYFISRIEDKKSAYFAINEDDIELKYTSGLFKVKTYVDNKVYMTVSVSIINDGLRQDLIKILQSFKQQCSEGFGV